VPRFDETSAECLVLTYKEGLLSAMGHDLVLRVDRFLILVDDQTLAIQAGFDAGRVSHVWVDETRPLLQGARLTAWELQRAGVPFQVVPDASAGALMARGLVDRVIVGADRIAANGDVANKIGTYPLALAARYHGLPFYVAAPWSTVDASTATGHDIVIEHRSADELGRGFRGPVAPAGVGVFNPAFDVTPAELVTAFITDRGVIVPPYRFETAGHAHAVMG